MCYFQSWEEITAPSLDTLNCVGPLRRANSTVDDLMQSTSSPLDMNRFTRHLKSLLDRVCRLTTKAPGDQISDDKALFGEDVGEDDTILEDTAEEESDWASNDKNPIESLLPQLV